MVEPMEEGQECPLCMEPLEMDDLNFFPCTCGYQICRFCWHRLRTDENGLCPACRKQYTECPADYTPLTQEELQKIKQEKKQKELQKKQKVTENRKHLSNVRVVQKNLVFVVGLSSRLADAEALKKNEYFGRFGKIHKVVINHTTSYAGSQGPSASAYVTYQRAEDALKAIVNVNNVHVDGRTIKASLGTTKYCSHFMKNQQCPKTDCMYLHELGDEAASFTKEEMQQGKHQEFERKLQEQYILSMSTKNGDNPGVTGGCKRTHKDSLSESSNNGTTSRVASSHSSTANIQPLESIVLNPGEVWPSLQTTKETPASSGGGVTVAPPPPPSSLHSSALQQGGGKKGRNKHNTNGTTHGLAAPPPPLNNSPRQTPTRDHNTTRRGRNDDSLSSNGGSIGGRYNNRESPASGEDTSDVQDETSSTPPPPPPCNNNNNNSSKIQHKNSSPQQHNKRPKSQSPNSANNQQHRNNKHNQQQKEQQNNKQQFNGTKQNTEEQTHEPEEQQERSITPRPTTPQHQQQTEDTQQQIDTADSSQQHSEVCSTPPNDLGMSCNTTPVSSESGASVNGDLQSSITAAQQSDDSSYYSHFTLSSASNLTANATECLAQQQLPSSSNIGSDWSSEEQPRHQGINNDHEDDIWKMIRHPPDEINYTQADAIDDDLGFDPFEETNKALAEDIIIEKKQREQQQRHQQLQQQSFQQQFQAESLRVKPFLNSNTNASLNTARFPPPGFNGIESIPNFTNALQQLQQQRQDTSKLIPSFLSNLSAQQQQASTLPMNGLVTSRISNLPPPGLGILSNVQQQNQQAGGLSALAGMPGPPNLTGLEGTLGGGPLLDTTGLVQHSQQTGAPPPGLSGLPKHDSFVMKDIENGLRNILPPMNPGVNSLGNMASTLNSSMGSTNLPPMNSSINSFNTLNGISLPPLSSLSSNSVSSLNTNNMSVFTSQHQQQQQHQLSALNALGNFGAGLGLSNNAQQQQSQQQVSVTNNSGNTAISNLISMAQQHQQQSILQQLALNSMHNQQQQQPKNWGASTTDLTALDPAIVSSGQLTDSRSDSPPDWLRQMEQHMHDNSSTTAWSSLLPPPNSSTSLLQHMPQAVAALQQQHNAAAALHRHQTAAAWPPTSPPPGFSSISPMHQSKHQQTHKIDNL